MKRTNPNSYPVTYAFEQFLIDQKIVHIYGSEMVLSPASPKIVETLHEMLGEYEHGTVDWNVVLEMVGMDEEAKWIKYYYNGHRLQDQVQQMEEDQKAEELQKKALEILCGVYEDIIATMINTR